MKGRNKRLRFGCALVVSGCVSFIVLALNAQSALSHAMLEPRVVTLSDPANQSVNESVPQLRLTVDGQMSSSRRSFGALSISAIECQLRTLLSPQPFAECKLDTKVPVPTMVPTPVNMSVTMTITDVQTVRAAARAALLGTLPSIAASCTAQIDWSPLNIAPLSSRVTFYRELDLMYGHPDLQALIDAGVWMKAPDLASIIERTIRPASPPTDPAAAAARENQLGWTFGWKDGMLSAQSGALPFASTAPRAASSAQIAQLHVTTMPASGKAGVEVGVTRPLWAAIALHRWPTLHR